jgi:hypothetical protein
MHVNRCALVVLDIEEVHPIRGGAPACVDGELAADQSRRAAQATFEIEIPWDDCHQVQIVIRGQCLDE